MNLKEKVFEIMPKKISMKGLVYFIVEVSVLIASAVIVLVFLNSTGKLDSVYTVIYFFFNYYFIDVVDSFLNYFFL